MIISKLPLPVYLFLTLGITVFLVITSILRYKKDRKAVIATYLSLAMGCLLISVLSISNAYFPLPNILIRIIQVILGFAFIIGIALMCYVGWTNKNDHNAKKKVIVSLSLFLAGAILFLIAYLI